MKNKKLLMAGAGLAALVLVVVVAMSGNSTMFQGKLGGIKVAKNPGGINMGTNGSGVSSNPDGKKVITKEDCIKQKINFTYNNSGDIVELQNTPVEIKTSGLIDQCKKYISYKIVTENDPFFPSAKFVFDEKQKNLQFEDFNGNCNQKNGNKFLNYSGENKLIMQPREQIVCEVPNMVHRLYTGSNILYPAITYVASGNLKKGWISKFERGGIGRVLGWADGVLFLGGDVQYCIQRAKS